MWVWDDGSFEVVIIKDESEGIKRFDYVGLVLASTQPGWRMGEVKLWIKQTATDGVYAAVVITGEKEAFNTILEIEEERIIDAMLPGSVGSGKRRTSRTAGPSLSRAVRLRYPS